MKIISSSVFVLVALGFAKALFAHGPVHQILKFESVKTEFVLLDYNTATPPVATPVKVMWDVKPNPYPLPKDSILFTVTIQRQQTSETVYSLLTLGVQAIEHNVWVRSAKAYTKNALQSSGPVFLDATDGYKEKAAPLDVPRTDSEPDPVQSSLRKVKSAAISFLKFTGDKCVIEVEISSGAINGARIGTTTWSTGTTTRDGHDNTPPPSSPD